MSVLQLEGRIAELQAGIAAALQGQKEAQQQTTDHRVQLDALRDTQASLQVSGGGERVKGEEGEGGGEEGEEGEGGGGGGGRERGEEGEGEEGGRSPH